LILIRELNEENERNERNKETNNAEFNAFLERIKEDYQNCGSQLQTALNKFAERYDAAKSKSIPRLCSFLYDLNRDLDPTVYIKSGSMIRVQVESIKRRKSGSSSGGKRKIAANISEGKENMDPGKKEHNFKHAHH
jgi:hypothetical protein